MGKGFGERDVETFLPSKTLIPVQPLGLLATSIALPRCRLKACMKLIGDTESLTTGGGCPHHILSIPFAVGLVDLGWLLDATTKLLFHHFPFTTRQEEKNTVKSLSVEIRIWRSLCFAHDGHWQTQFMEYIYFTAHLV